MFFGPGRKFDGPNVPKKFKIRSGIWKLAAAGTALIRQQSRSGVDFRLFSKNLIFLTQYGNLAFFVNRPAPRISARLGFSDPVGSWTDKMFQKSAKIVMVSEHRAARIRAQPGKVVPNRAKRANVSNPSARSFVCGDLLLRRGLKHPKEKRMKKKDTGKN